MSEPNIFKLLQKSDQLIQTGLSDKAAPILRKVIATRPDIAEAHYMFGYCQSQEGRWNDAAISFGRATKLRPTFRAAWVSLGFAHYSLKNFATCVSAWQSANRLGDDMLTYLNIGRAYIELGRDDEAESALRQCLALDSKSAEAMDCLGRCLQHQSRFSEAISLHNQAVSFETDPTEQARTYTHLGNAWVGLQNLEKAMASYKKATECDPNYPNTWRQIAFVQNMLGRYDAAEVACLKSIELDPKSPETWGILGSALLGQKRYKDAVDCYNNSLELNRKSEFILGHKLNAKMQICDWRALAKELPQITHKINQGEKVANPFVLLALTSDLPIQRKVAEIFVESQYPERFELGSIPRYSQHERIRIGYYSADFHNHPISFLMAELIELHDRSQFEVIGFSFGHDNQDEMRQRISAAFDQFIDVSRKSDKEIADISRHLEIDIAIDLGGFTKNGRTGIFAYRAAPIQINYLGYSATMGSNYILISHKVQQAHLASLTG